MERIKATNTLIHTTHGQKNHELYPTWRNMIDRCYNLKSSSYKSYGLRGITVCESWRNSIQAFLTDMGERPPGYTLERVNVNGNYESSNCKWIPFRLQARNRRSNRMVEYKGEIKPICDWAKQFGKDYRSIICRVERGWFEEDALEKPIRQLKRDQTKLKILYGACTPITPAEVDPEIKDGTL